MTVCSTQKDSPKEHTGQAIQQAAGNEPLDSGRRTAIRKLAVGAAALAGCSMLPDKWTSPLIEFGSLPAHAVTSGAAQQTAAATTETLKTEVIQKSGYISIDKVLRPKFVSPKMGWDYGKSIRIVFNTGGEIIVGDTRHDVITRENRVYRTGGRRANIPTMEVYAEPKSKATYITIYYKG